MPKPTLSIEVVMEVWKDVVGYEGWYWVTSSENHLHACRVLGVRMGEKNGSAKLKDKDIPLIRTLLFQKELLYKEIAALFNVSGQTINNIKTGHTWTHI